MSEAIQIVTTTSERADAERIATSLVARHLAACVQVSGPMESTYRWEGNIETSEEWVCTIKSVRELYPAIEAMIRELHSYEEPQIVALPIVDGSAGYLQWVADSVRQPAS